MAGPKNDLSNKKDTAVSSGKEIAMNSESIKHDLSGMSREDVEHYFKECILKNKIFFYTGEEGNNLLLDEGEWDFIEAQRFKQVSLGCEGGVDKGYVFNGFMLDYAKNKLKQKAPKEEGKIVAIRLKRVAAKEIKPIIYKGIKYAVQHWGRFRENNKEQNGGYIEAWDVKSGKKLWELKIYDVSYDEALEKDVQDVFITSLKLKKEKLIVTNEANKEYQIDLKTKEITEDYLFSDVFAQDVSSVVNANNQFAFDLYSKYKLKDGNIFFCPYGIFSAIAMVYEGARGKTAEEIRSVFHLPKNDSLRRKSFLKINNIINRNGKKYKLIAANALWAQKEYKFLNDYFNLVGQYYGGNVTNLDFINETELSRLSINDWVEKHASDKLKDLIPKGILGPLARMVLTNAVYFKGIWLNQFDKKDTKDEDFRVALGNTIKVPMMHLNSEEAEFNYGETDKLQILELPYEGEDLAMLILLPKADDLRTVEEFLSFGKLSEWKKSLKKEKVMVFLPKFKIENKYFMAEDLKEMGMRASFTLGIDYGGKADFSGMTGKKELNINEVIHQAFVDVNEEGTEAAAATGVMMLEGCAAPEPNKIKMFKADHPFVFLIQEKENENILFVGKVSNPAQ